LSPKIKKDPTSPNFPELLGKRNRRPQQSKVIDFFPFNEAYTRDDHFITMHPFTCPLVNPKFPKLNCKSRFTTMANLNTHIRKKRCKFVICSLNKKKVYRSFEEDELVDSRRINKKRKINGKTLKKTLKTSKFPKSQTI
jgi:hypothetical protein